MNFIGTLHKKQPIICACSPSAQFLLLLVFFFGLSMPLNASTAENVSLLSRIDFAPTLLEMISHELKCTAGREFSLVVRSVETENASSPVDLNSYLLVEEGIEKSFLPPGSELTNISVRLIWALAVQKSISPLKINDKTTLEEFGKFLLELKNENPDKFPWFEGLLSRNTMRNFCLILGERKFEKSKNSISEQPFWKQPHATAILYKAIEAELLNPLSIESDLSLAMDVFEAGDAMFASLWVPESCFKGKSEICSILKNSFIIPFPSSDGTSKLPVITLQLWKTAGTPTMESPKPETNSENDLHYSMINLNYASETLWLEKNFAPNYDALIVGDQ